MAGFERSSEKKMFAIVEVHRYAAAIESRLNTYTLLGTVIYTDSGRAYDPACKSLGLKHKPQIIL